MKEKLNKKVTVYTKKFICVFNIYYLSKSTFL